MSKQIAILLDTSGSMFQSVGGGNVHLKIFETARGAEFFIQNLIDRLVDQPTSQFAVSVHHFASSYELLPGGNQVDSSDAGFSGLLDGLKGGIPAIESQPAVQVVVGSMTDLYDAVRKTADYLVSPLNQPGFGAPTSRVMFLFSDGIQTIAHNGGTTRASYEAEKGVTFHNLLNNRGIKMVAWGVGSDALGTVLADLKDQAVAGGTNPVSDSKVLFPIDESGTFPNCTTIAMNTAFEVVDNNGILPLRPAGQPGSGLLWEQFSLPYRQLFASPTTLLSAVVPAQMVNYRDFEVEVDGSNELILGMVTHSREVRATIQATSPSGVTFTNGSAGTRTVSVATASALKIAHPEQGTWSVRVTVDANGKPTVIDLMARAVFPEFSLQVETQPHILPAPGKVQVIAWPRLDGQPAAGALKAKVEVLGGDSADLVKQPDGSFAGTVAVTRLGVSILRVAVHGKLASGKFVNRFRFATVMVGQALDPRFTLSPNIYRQGHDYSVQVNLFNGRFTRRTAISFGSGISVLDFQVLNDVTAEAQIRVASDAFIGEREAVTFNPEAESIGTVRVLDGERGHGPRGRVHCLRFDACGRLVGIVLDDGTQICVHLCDDRLQQLLERAREQRLTLEITLDSKGCLAGLEVCI
jgi:hypothetical protein